MHLERGGRREMRRGETGRTERDERRGGKWRLGGEREIRRGRTGRRDGEETRRGER